MVSTDNPVPSTSPAMQNFDYGLGHLTDIAGLNYVDFQIFSDISDSIPVYDLSSDPIVSPMSSLVDAYFDYSTEEIPFSGIFNNYIFNDYIDIDTVNQALFDTYNNSMTQINFSPDMSWHNFVNANGYDLIGNAHYEDFLHSSIDYFNSIENFKAALYCEQQLHILDYCDSHDVDFCNTFINI